METDFARQGFFRVLLYTDEDTNKVWAKSSILLKPSIVQLHAWTLDFNPKFQKFTNYQV